MSTPLYKRMKSNGSSFYCFPSSALDLSSSYNNKSYKMNFSKFVLLNIPSQIRDSQTVSGKTILDFRGTKSSTDSTYNFYMNNIERSQPNSFSTEMVESLRNYVANYDSTVIESKQTVNKDFFNISETKKPTEMIFWKWLRKTNVLDLEPAQHKMDWDKNLEFFDNPYNSTVLNQDYFRKYLWKEREVISYGVYEIEYLGGDESLLKISETVKFRNGDFITLSGSTISGLDDGVYEILDVVVDTNTQTSEIKIESNYNGGIETGIEGLTVVLNYKRLVQYIGEINQNSTTQTAKKNYLEVTAYIPNQGGKTPSVLWKIYDNTNYYPNLELPLLPQEIQDEIIGAENLDSPIRQNPQNYPGTFYGQFDTSNKTYKCSSGDRYRLSGDYYGIKLTNNVGLDSENYFEKLNDFNSSNIDGLSLDFSPTHYLKMNLPDRTVNNFDEFSALSLDGQTPPEDFEFNAILWYYEIDKGDGSDIETNLYGITFLNNPEDDYQELCEDPSNQHISTYRKLVSNGNQDGLSYIFNLNINFEVDNDMIPASYDPVSVYNMFGFDLYNRVMSNLSKLNEQFMNIIQSFVNINNEVNNMKSLIYSQTDLDVIKKKMKNLEELLKLYKTNQIVETDTVKIEVDYTGVYPALKLHAIDLEYSDIDILKTSTIYDYNINNSGLSYTIEIPYSNQKLLIVENDSKGDITDNLKIVLNRDLHYKQSFNIWLDSNLAQFTNRLDVNLLFEKSDGQGVYETALIQNLYTPVDLSTYDLNTGIFTYNRTYYNTSKIEETIDLITPSGTTTILNTTTPNVFINEEYVYVDNFILMNTATTETYNYNGVYKIKSSNSVYIELNDFIIDGDINGHNVSLGGKYNLLTIPKISSYKGMLIKVLRVNESNESSISDRYKITRTLY